MMTIKRFFQYYDQGENGDAKQTLICPEDCKDLWNWSDRYFGTLEKLRTNAIQQIQLCNEMKKV